MRAPVRHPQRMNCCVGKAASTAWKRSRELLEDWEIWSADLMESHLSYPVLAYFRSQHDNQSWIASLTAILDVCSLAMVGLEGMCQYQARMTFAIARHALVDLSQVFSAPPAKEEKINRLPPESLDELRKRLHRRRLCPGRWRRRAWKS